MTDQSRRKHWEEFFDNHLVPALRADEAKQILSSPQENAETYFTTCTSADQQPALAAARSLTEADIVEALSEEWLNSALASVVPQLATLIVATEPADLTEATIPTSRYVMF